MKGISEIIATILMLMITLGISGTAYLFISGAFTQQTQGIEVVDAFCQGDANDTVNIIVRNLGSSAVSTSSITITQTVPAEPTTPEQPHQTWVGHIDTIPPGTTGTMQDACEGDDPRSCIYRILPPAGRSIVASVQCI